MYFKYRKSKGPYFNITKFHDGFRLPKTGLAFGMYNCTYIFVFWISLLVFILSIVLTFGVNVWVTVALLDASLLKLSNCFHYFYVEAGGYKILHA